MVAVAQQDTIKETFIQALASSAAQPLATIGREEALARLESQDFPTTRHEEWKYFNLRSLLKESFVFGAGEAKVTSEFLPENEQVNLFVFLDGQLMTSHLAEDIEAKNILLMPLSRALEEKTELVHQHLGKYTTTNENIFVSLNTAYTQDGLFLYVPKSAVLEYPVVVRHILTSTESENRAVQARNLLVAEANASAKFIERVETQGEGASFFNTVTEVVVARDARVDIHKVQEDTEKAFQIHQTFVEQDDNSHFADNTFSFSGGMIRNNLYIGLSEHNEAFMNGFFLLDDKTVVDNHTVADHRKPHSMSDELYKGVLDGRSKGIFNGKIFVRQDAQKTKSFQSNANMLLSDKATIDTKPQLEIWADDVRCTHGATTGAMDKEQLFYLRARGISERKAKVILLRAFLGQVLDRLTIDWLKSYLEGKIEERLG